MSEEENSQASPEVVDSTIPADQVVEESTVPEEQNNIPVSEEECSPCRKGLLASLTTAIGVSRSSCEYLPKDEDKEKCRENIAEIAKNIKEYKSAEDVIVKHIKSAPDIDAAIQAQIKMAKQYDEVNADALIKVVTELEAEGKPISPETQKVVDILRITRG
jgi:hypothetical protein